MKTYKLKLNEKYYNAHVYDIGIHGKCHVCFKYKGKDYTIYQDILTEYGEEVEKALVSSLLLGKMSDIDIEEKSYRETMKIVSKLGLSICEDFPD